MEYGLLGAKLGHSFSPEVHSRLGDYEYELKELTPVELIDFIKRREFRAVNVTIPYKETVMPYLDRISDEAKAVGSVNTVVNKDGKLYGYNTDFFGMKMMLDRNGIVLTGKKVLIFGSGGTCKTAVAVARSLGASSVTTVSRTGKNGGVSYESAYTEYADAEVIYNTTPVGMFPDTDGVSVDVSAFPKLEAFIDVIYNPLRTLSVLHAKSNGLKNTGGLYMLVAQAVAANELFFGRPLPPDLCEGVYSEILSLKENVVLTGMPSSGKSCVGRRVAELLGRPFFDTDKMIEESAGKCISDIFAQQGEKYFRDAETEAVRRAGKNSGAVIATGGGAVLRPENLTALRQNGRIFFLDRPLGLLTPTTDRPLGNTADKIRKTYEERYGIYSGSCDVRIDSSGSVEDAANEIVSRFIGNIR